MEFVVWVQDTVPTNAAIGIGISCAMSFHHMAAILAAELPDLSFRIMDHVQAIYDLDSMIVGHLQPYKVSTTYDLGKMINTRFNKTLKWDTDAVCSSTVLQIMEVACALSEFYDADDGDEMSNEKVVCVRDDLVTGALQRRINAAPPVSFMSYRDNDECCIM